MSTTDLIENWHGFFPHTEESRKALAAFEQVLRDEEILIEEPECGHIDFSTRVVKVNGSEFIEAKFTVYAEVPSSTEGRVLEARRQLRHVADVLVVHGFNDDGAAPYVASYQNASGFVVSSLGDEQYLGLASALKRMHELVFNTEGNPEWVVATATPKPDEEA